MSSSDRPYRILSLDGGGMRGIYQTVYLRYFVEALSRYSGNQHSYDIGKGFDLIVGTSTGGLIATALFAGIELSKIEDLYLRQGSSIFPSQTLRSVPGLSHLALAFGWGNSKGDKALRTSLEDTFYDWSIGDTYRKRRIALCIPTVNLSNWKPVVFKTSHLPRSNKRDDSRLLTDICLATTAAPIYRVPASIPEPGIGEATYVDGGLWANNPAIIGMTDAIEFLAPAPRPIHLYMLGSPSAPVGTLNPSAKRYKNAFGWGIGARVAMASLDAMAPASDYVVRSVLKSRHDGSFAYRFPSLPQSQELTKVLARMDDARHRTMEALRHHASIDVDSIWPLCTSQDDREPLRLFRQIVENSVT